MTSVEARRASAITRLLSAIAIACGAVALILTVTGGFTVHPFGLRMSAHGALRPALLAMLFAGLAIRSRPARRQAEILARAAGFTFLLPVAAALAAAMVFAATAKFGAHAAGGSDGYGYISEARLWLQGDLHVHQDFAAQIPWPNAEWTFTPLGYRPADNHTIVPTYAPGVPLLMALLSMLIGPCGLYLVNPLCAGALVLITYGLGARVSDRVIGAIAAVLVASSPAVLFSGMWPMSDVPAAAFWALALLLATGTSARAAAAAGVVAGIAIVIRPNLALLAIFPFLLLSWPARCAPRRVVGLAGAFAAACLPFVLFIAWVNNSLYGSPFQSGYGATADIFSAANTTANLTRYPRWLWETQGPLVFVFPFAIAVRSIRWRNGILLAFVGAVWGCYLWYEPFDAWWYLRFVLPAFPVMFILAADVVWRAAARLGTRGRLVAAVVFTYAMADFGMTQARERGAFTIGEGEQKFADVGRYVTSRLPANAVAVALLHSGSIRYYSGQRTLRWDWLDGAWLDRAVDYLRAAGSEPYFVLDRSEVEAFRKRFATQQTVRVLDRQPTAVHPRGVYIYDARADANRPTETIPATTGCN